MNWGSFWGKSVYCILQLTFHNKISNWPLSLATVGTSNIVFIAVTKPKQESVVCSLKLQPMAETPTKPISHQSRRPCTREDVASRHDIFGSTLIKNAMSKSHIFACTCGFGVKAPQNKHASLFTHACTCCVLRVKMLNIIFRRQDERVVVWKCLEPCHPATLSLFLKSYRRTRKDPTISLLMFTHIFVHNFLQNYSSSSAKNWREVVEKWGAENFCALPE